mgnify:CR=1 FL=1
MNEEKQIDLKQALKTSNSEGPASEATAELRPTDLQAAEPRRVEPQEAKTQQAAIMADVKNLELYYGDFHALKDINITIPERQVTAFIGPSGCGKSTLLRCFNRMNDLIESCHIQGEIHIKGRNILSSETDVVTLRTHVGMVFQQPNPFPMSIYDNIAYGLRCQGIRDKQLIAERVESSLKKAALWEEVKDHLNRSATRLSGGQQQRLCIARAIALQPTLLLMDEPTSALDPMATSKIEDLVEELKTDYTTIIVTHSMSQAARVSDRTAFFLLGEIVETGSTEQIFHKPEDPRTEAYISGKFG